MRNRRTVLAIAALLGVMTLAIRHPSADFRLITQDAADPSPHRMEAAIDLGLVGVSVLYTWTVKNME